jgi:integrase
MLKESNVRTGFVETAVRLRLEQACSRIGLWMLAIFEVGCTYGWRHASLLKMRVNQVDPNGNVIRLEPGTTKNKKGLEVTMPRRVRELLLQCIQGKRPDDYLFTRPNGKRVKDFRGSWERVCRESGLPGLRFHDLRRTAARNMRRGHVSEKVAMEVGGWKTTSVFHRYAIVDNQDIADARTCWRKAKISYAATPAIGRHAYHGFRPLMPGSQSRIDPVSADLADSANHITFTSRQQCGEASTATAPRNEEGT